MLKRLKKRNCNFVQYFLGLHLCTSEFSQSIFGCSRVCERRVCRIRPRVCKGFESGASKSEDFGRVATALHGIGTVEVQVCDRNLYYGKWHWIWARLGCPRKQRNAFVTWEKFNIPGVKTSEDFIEY